MSAALSLTEEQLEDLAERIATKLRAKRTRSKKAASPITELDRARAAKVAASHGLLTKTRKVHR